MEEIYLELFNGSKGLKILRCTEFLEDVEDEENLAKIIEQEHLRNNHRGIDVENKELRLLYYHPCLKDRVTKFVNNCEVCNTEKYERRPIRHKLQLTETPSGPNEIIHIDVFYTLEQNLFLTFIDKFTKFAQAIKITGRSWTEFKRALLLYMSGTGDIGRIVVDNELGFKAIPLREFLSNSNIEIHYTSNNNHTSNSDIERLHNTINEHIRLLKHDDERNTNTVEEKILEIILFYNSTVHSTTGKRPIDFRNGKVKDDEYADIKDRIQKVKERVINKLNEGREEVEIEEGANFIKETRGGKNYAKFRKIDAEKLDETHILNKETGLKYYGTHLKRKKKFQNFSNPTIKTKPKPNRRRIFRRTET